MALESRTAATEESTPPESAQSAFPSPIFSLNSCIVFCAKSSIFQLPEQPQIPITKLRRISFPNIVCSTSG